MSFTKENFLISVCGPTGIGKTRLAITLARTLGCEILSADSRQIFREMTIGTAVPSEEELSQVKHHFIRSHSVADYYNASLFEQEVITFLNDYFKQHQQIVMVGGSGMYLNAVYTGIDDLPTIKTEIRKKWHDLYTEKGIEYLQQLTAQLDPVYYEKVDRLNPKRLQKALEVYEQTGKPYSSFLTNSKKLRSFKILKIGLNTDRNKLYDQINKRVDQMMQAGLLEEARSLLPFRDMSALKTVGYREIFEYLDGTISLDEAIQKIKDHSRAYARRQITWFRRDPEIHWFEPNREQTILEFVRQELPKMESND
ncbi:MAG: tRNA (adenosine(37)-N6)-dimethylallyltransferase MiaA [Bacteroidales bacterium]|nr:tRNA (adenosine(37)-N6)-dimethylallyltransferase MiaA [Bacteroidales bacterium]